MSIPRSESVVRLPLIDNYLREQRQLTAVEQFAHKHDLDPLMGGDRFYRDPIPLALPGLGQQYAFQVDLDSCTGCQACVTGCHRMNGLDGTEAETWRNVGTLRGGTSEAPLQMSVTAACHHCVDPACMNGCPVGAYEKDAKTGIVRHLDDQCIGCQYCVLTCPYEVPQFNQRLGVVRKCDMCAGRLEAGEAPACVQACPNEAISIQVVDKAQIVAETRTNALVPGAPSSSFTSPTTRYLTKAGLPDNLLPANFHDVKAAKGHTPLAIMLVLTQWSVGAFALDFLLRGWSGWSPPGAPRAYHLIGAALVGVLAIAASTLHLGRPALAFRAVLGLRTSWLSREVLVFGLFTPLALAYAALTWWAGRGGYLPPTLLWLTSPSLGGLLAVIGLVGVFCSTMIYGVTRKQLWAPARVGLRFLMTVALLGASSAMVSVLAGGDAAGSSRGLGARCLALGVAALGLAKLGWEVSVLGHLRDGEFTELKRTAILLRGELGRAWLVRMVLGALGGVLLPLALGVGSRPRSPLDVALSSLALVLLAAGEIAERDLFFRAVSGPRMPGQGRR